MRDRRLFRFSVVAVSGGLVLGLAACSSGSASPTHTSPGTRVVVRAYKKTLEAATARFSVRTSGLFRVGKSTKWLTTVQTGMVSFATQGFVGLSISAFDKGSKSGTRKIRNPIEVSGFLYERIPSVDRSLVPRGKKWLRFDVKPPVAHRGSPLSVASGLGEFEQASPLQELSLLVAVSSKVVRVGTRPCGGTRTTEYKVSVDKRRLARWLRQSYGRGVGESLLTFDSSRDTRFLRIWIDGSGRLRCISERTAVPFGVLDSGVATETATFSDYGVPVHIGAPPEREIDRQP